MNPDADLLSRFTAHLPNLRGKRVCVALSGGVDSVVLLHLLAHLQHKLALAHLSAIHVHHGLNPQADDWQQFCQQYADSLHLDFTAHRVQINPKELGIEAAARNARYAIFAQQNCDILALAHHQNDQIETFWLATLRGGSLRALSAMPTQRPLKRSNGAGSLTLLRPLLPFTRAEIEAYAAQNQLAYVHDNSNDNSDLLRNWLRLDLLPYIEHRLPAHAQHVLRSIATLQDERTLLDEIAEQDWQLTHPNGHFSQHIWQQLSAVRQRQILHQFALRHNLGTPSAGSLHNFAAVLQTATTGEWALPHGRAILHNGILWAVHQNFAQSWAWTQHHHAGSLQHLATQLGLSWQNGLPIGAGSIRSARRDDVLHTEIGRKNVFRILQEKRVPPFVRPFWAVACNATGQCVALANIRSDARWGKIRLQSDALQKFLT